MARCSLAQLHEIAQQLLLKEKEWKDFKWLDEDDMERIKALMARGDQLFSEKEDWHRQVRPTAVGGGIHPLRPGNYIYVPERQKQDISLWASRVGFTPFPVDKIRKEKTSLHRLWFEALNRELSGDDWGVLLTRLPETQFLLLDLPERVAKDLRFNMEGIGAELPSYEVENVLARYSLCTVRFLRQEEGVPESLTSFAKAYAEQLDADLKKYCQGLAQKMGVVEKLSHFSDEKWQRLSGLFPRRDLSRLRPFLPGEVTERLMRPLPPEQKKDVEEGQRFFERELAQGFEGYHKVLESLKSLNHLVHNLSRQDA